MNQKKKAIIIGAGPAGLTAAYQLLKNTEYVPIILESAPHIGGISKTVNFKGNRIDLGGHRFFTKSERVNQLWNEIMRPALPHDPTKDRISNDYMDTDKNKLSTEESKKRFLTRSRISRIFYQKKFFDYPVLLSVKTLRDLGFVKTLKIIWGFFYIKIFPKKDESTLENFYINRFGTELYKTFFKSYTEKLWGIPPSQISSEWGAQRVKGVSLTGVVIDSIKKMLGVKNNKNTETSLIEQFKYPALGPGQLWETLADKITKMGGEILLNHTVCQIDLQDNKILSFSTENTEGGVSKFEGDIFFSTMAVKDLVKSLNPKPLNELIQIAEGLPYRDFITVGLLYNDLKIRNQTNVETLNNRIPDNWLYIHEPNVQMCRIQIFNNWSPFMVADQKNTWLGLEYVCDEKDTFWKMPDQEIIEQAKKELSEIGIADNEKFLDGTVIRMKKTYPAYSSTYKDFGKLREYLDTVENLYLIGRNGMHRYNNQDHSMLTAMVAVDNIKKGVKNRENVWQVNTEAEYHEEKK